MLCILEWISDFRKLEIATNEEYRVSAFANASVPGFWATRNVEPKYSGKSSGTIALAG